MAWPRSLVCALAVLSLMAGCTEPPASNRVAPGTTASLAGAAGPRSTGNAALAARFVMLFEQACLPLDASQAARTLEGRGFRRGGVSDTAAFLGPGQGDAWAYRGHDTYIAAFRPGPPRSCEMGVHLAEAQQVEAPFAALMERLRGQGWAISPLGREPRLGSVIYRAVAPDGRGMLLALTPMPTSSRLFRSGLIAQEAPAPQR